jgi:hypothetical protein
MKLGLNIMPLEAISYRLFFHHGEHTRCDVWAKLAPFNVKGKVKLSLCLSKYQAKMLGGVEV